MLACSTLKFETVRCGLYAESVTALLAAETRLNPSEREREEI
jgi:hypothetical protein